MPPAAASSSTVRSRLQAWLFRHGPDTGPVTLGQRRIYILPTRAGLGFAAALATMLIGAINYNLSLGHALVFLLAGLGLAAMLATFRNLLGLTIAPGRAEPVFAGETAHFTLRLSEQRGEPRRALTLTAGDSTPSTINTPANGDSNVVLQVTTTQRGRLRLPRVRLESRYPLGFFVAWTVVEPPVFCLIYPRPLLSPLPPPTAISRSGSHAGDSGQEDFAGLRPRQPADPLRHVAWKAAAREVGDRPLPVKQFAGGADTELWLDWADLPGNADLETKLSQLTGWVLAAEAEGLPYGLRLPPQHFPPAHGGSQRTACLEALALYGQAR
jgi:uncharacterized protein (DUF58 family)